MKKIVHCFLMAAVCAVPHTLIAQEEEDTQTQEEAAVQEKGDPLESARARVEELTKKVSEFKDPSKSFVARFESMKKDTERYYTRLEEARKKVAQAREKLQALSGVNYEFTEVKLEERYKYENEGGALVKKVSSLLGGKEAEQIEGVQLFEKLNSEYQGITGYPEARALYKKVLDRMEKKWSSAKTKVNKERQKQNANQRSKAEDAEEAAYNRYVKKLEGMEKDISKDWFVPTSAMMVNLRVLDHLLQRVTAARRVLSNEPDADAGKCVEKVHAYWEVMDSAAAAMMDGEYEEAKEKITDSDAIDEVRSISRYCMPDEYKQRLMEQHRKLRSEIDSRRSKTESAKNELRRHESTEERAVSSLREFMDKMTDLVENEKEALDRKAEEEAERKAEEEAERKAAEAEDDEEEDEKPVKKKKKDASQKKGSKKS